MAQKRGKPINVYKWTNYIWGFDDGEKKSSNIISQN